MTRWRRYWFAERGRLAAAIVRVAIAVAVLLCLRRLAMPVSTGDVPGEHTMYRPVGVWMLLGHHAPSDALVSALWAIAWASTAAMLVGLCTRASTVVSFVSACALAALSFAAQKTWSHQYNVVFLAQLAFFGARGGDTLSIDALIRRARGLPPCDEPRGYQWSLRLVQLAVALMFAGAAFHKLLHGHFTLRWALSDNLRNQLLVRYDLADLPRPALVQWLIDDPWKYRTAAALNLITQSAPIFACIFVRRPIVRALAGACFLIETVALAHVVGLWNPQWLPLYAAFVDWDALVARLARRPARAPSPDAQPRRGISIFVGAFVGYELLTAFVPTVDQRLDTYPFSSFPMFATVRARAPYGEHLPYAIEGGHFEVISDQPIDLPIQRWFDHQHRTLYAVRDPDDLERRLRAMLAQAQLRYPDSGIRGLRLYLSIFVAPPVPAPAHFELHPIAIVGALERDGTFRTALGTLDGDRAEPHPRNVDLAGARVVFYRDDVPTPVDAPGDGDPIIAAAIASDGTPWLVATREQWHWQ